MPSLSHLDELEAEAIYIIREVAAELEVNGTPAFIIDGEILRGAPRSKNDITRLLKK